MRIVLLDRFDMNRSQPLQNGEAQSFSYTRIRSVGRRALAKADLVLYVDQKYQQPAYVSIVKDRYTPSFNPFRTIINSIIDRYYHLQVLSSMVEIKLIPYELKEFIINELKTTCDEKDKFEFITGDDLRG